MQAEKGMQTPLYRSHVTDLSENELLLLDVLFSCNSSFECLSHENFKERWNCRSHNLDDTELHSTLHRLCDRGILDTDRHAGVPYFRMTENGGHLWSLERC